MFLQESDQSDFFPSATSSNAELKRLIAIVNRLIEGPSGANRPLGLKQYKETISINQSLLTGQLGYLPIDFGQAIAVEGRRGNVRDRNRKAVGLTEWFAIEDDSYLLDEDGLISFRQEGFDFGLRQGRGIWLTEARVTYFSGLDLTSTDDEIVELKYLASEILLMIESADYDPATGRTIKEEGASGVDKIVYSESSGMTGRLPIAAPGINPSMLMPFHKYRPKVLPF